MLKTLHTQKIFFCTDPVRLYCLYCSAVLSPIWCASELQFLFFFKNYLCISLNFGHRQMKLNNELNNMSWRVRPDEVLLEVGRLFGSKIGLQKLNFEVNIFAAPRSTHTQHKSVRIVFILLIDRKRAVFFYRRAFRCNNLASVRVGHRSAAALRCRQPKCLRPLAFIRAKELLSKKLPRKR